MTFDFYESRGGCFFNSGLEPFRSGLRYHRRGEIRPLWFRFRTALRSHKRIYFPEKQTSENP